VHGDEHERPTWREHEEHRGEVGEEVCGQQHGLDPPGFDLAAPHGLDARPVQVEAFWEQQREEQECLVLRQPPQEAALAPALARGERERGDVEVGVGVLDVGVGVVAGVFADPPPVAQADQPTHGQPDRVVGPAVVEDLLVPGVVPDERQLGVQHGQERRGEQLPPGVPEKAERHPGRGEDEQCDGALHRVVHRPAPQETGLPYCL
jgi:hypothetical protein